MTETTLIVGLGNPGAQYAHTRHNAGFMVLDALAADAGVTFSTDSKLRAEVTRVKVNGRDLILAKPTTFMNSSGDAVAVLLAYYKLPLSALIVVHDDSDLALGELRDHTDRGAGGHNGVADIIRVCGTKGFRRLRIGVRPARPDDAPSDTPHIKAMTFVLKDFAGQEKDTLARVISDAVAALTAQNKTAQ